VKRKCITQLLFYDTDYAVYAVYVDATVHVL